MDGATQETQSCCPSLCSQGYIADGRCPLHLGVGLGPKVFHELYQMWDRCSDKYDFTEEQLDMAKQISGILYSTGIGTEGPVSDQMMSGQLSVPMNTFIQTVPNWAKLHIIHQTAVSASTSECADITTVDKLTLRIQNVLVCKLVSARNDFPEIQASAYSKLWAQAKVADRNQWMPVFALSASHLRIGIAFGDLIEQQWAYSEIFSAMESFNPGIATDVLTIARFMTFFAESACLHLCRTDQADDFLYFMEKSGAIIPVTPDVVLGDRVLGGRSSDGSRKVMKFYGTIVEAEDAIARSKLMTDCLEYGSTEPKAYEGFGPDATCIVVDDFFKDCACVTYTHLICLTKHVGKLYASEVMHGDLRFQNIRFLEGGDVRLIDGDWCGKRRSARFPAAANMFAFGPRAQKSVQGSAYIPSDFDCRCLADILETVGCPAEAAAADNADFARVLALLESKKSDPTDLASRFGCTVIPEFLNLFALGGRLAQYYRSTGASKKRKSAAAS